MNTGGNIRFLRNDKPMKRLMFGCDLACWAFGIALEADERLIHFDFLCYFLIIDMGGK